MKISRRQLRKMILEQMSDMHTAIPAPRSPGGAMEVAAAMQADPILLNRYFAIASRTPPNPLDTPDPVMEELRLRVTPEVAHEMLYQVASIILDAPIFALKARFPTTESIWEELYYHPKIGLG